MSNMRYFTAPPRCPACKSPTTRAITNTNNNNLGNAGRPYYKCKVQGCGEFYCFDDSRGIFEENEACYCGRPSRLAVGAAAVSHSRNLVFQCATSACGYKNQACDKNGNGRTVKEADILQWVRDGKL